MKPICDYHMHTPLCGHAVGEPAEYAQKAIELGLKEIGFSCHAPFVHMVDPRVTMGMDQLPQYYQMIEAVREKYKNELTIKVGLEADFVLGYEEKTQALLDDYPYDYVIGSVHFIKDWGFDDPSQRDQWNQADINQVYRDYYELLRQSALSGMFNIIGHPELVKKFGHKPTDDMLDEVRKCAQVFKETGMAIEINTGGLRKPVKEMYPQQSHLEIYADVGVPVTFGSDAHDPRDVGYAFDDAMKAVAQAGFTEYVTFSKGAIDQRISL